MSDVLNNKLIIPEHIDMYNIRTANKTKATYMLPHERRGCITPGYTSGGLCTFSLPESIILQDYESKGQLVHNLRFSGRVVYIHRPNNHCPRTIQTILQSTQCGIFRALWVCMRLLVRSLIALVWSTDSLGVILDHISGAVDSCWRR